MKWKTCTFIIFSGLMALMPVSGSADAMTNSSNRTTYIQQEVSNANAYISDSSVKTEKYQAMEASPFDFYRATNFLYYRDLDNGTIAIPSEWKSTSEINTWLSGDFHAQNIGFFGNDQGNIVFDLNDFDDAYIGPFYWDLLRFTTSLYLLRENLSWDLSKSDTRDLAQEFLVDYQDTLDKVNGNPDETTAVMDKGTVTGFIDDQMDDLQKRDNTHQLDKWTVTDSNGNRSFDMSNSDLAPATSQDLVDLQGHWPSYLQDISDQVNKWGSDYFTVKGYAQRLHSGLGSLGLKKYYVLIEGPTSSNDDDVILQVKEQQPPNMLLNSMASASTFNSQFTNPADAARTAYKALENNVDDHLGVLTGASTSYLVSQISPMKRGLDPEDFNSKSDLEDFVTYSAQALAYAHARSDKDYKDQFISYNFENGALNAIDVWPKFKTHVLDLSEAYADQVDADYQSFLQLMQNGQLP